MADIYSYTRQSFSWKPGAYRLKVAIESPDSFTILDDEYTFLLTPLQVQKLADNLKHLEQYYANEVVPLQEGEQLKTITWNWVYPEMQRLDG